MLIKRYWTKLCDTFFVFNILINYVWAEIHISFPSFNNRTSGVSVSYLTFPRHIVGLLNCQMVTDWTRGDMYTSTHFISQHSIKLHNLAYPNCPFVVLVLYEGCHQGGFLTTWKPSGIFKLSVIYLPFFSLSVITAPL